MIFDGVGFAKKIEKKLKRDGDLIGKKLIIFRADETDGESVYIKLKREMGERLGVEVEVIKGVPTPVVIQDYGKASGILVQLPITGVSETERDEILSLIPLEKDVDGLNPNGSKFLPAVVVAVEKILANVKGRTLDMGVVGSEGMVGKALTRRFANLGFRVKGIDIIDIKGDNFTQNERRSSPWVMMRWGSEEAKETLKKADVVVSAVGQPGLIGPEMIKRGVAAIDLGYPKGDFDKAVVEKAGFFTPVPGGAGPVTIVSLFENLSKTKNERSNYRLNSEAATVKSPFTVAR